MTMLWWAFWQLRSANATTRLRALARLAEADDPRVGEALLRALDDADRGVRVAATRALGQRREATAIPALITRMFTCARQGDISARDEAIDALGRIENPLTLAGVLSMLDRVTDDKDLGTARDPYEFVATLATKLGPGGLLLLADRAMNGDASARLTAVKVLGHMSGDLPARALVPVLADTNRDIRSAAVIGLAATASPDALEPLIAMFSDADTNRVRQAMLAVAKIGGERAVQALVGLLSSGSSFIRDSAQAELIRLNWRPITETDRILLALARQDRWPEPEELGQQAVVRLLELLTDADRNIRDRAASMLGKLADPRATDPLIHALADQDEMLRVTAVAALGELGDRRAVPPLIDLLAKVEGSYMAEALPQALGKLGDPRALIPLASAASAVSNIAPFVAHAAVPAIEAILNASAKDATLDALHILADLTDLAEKVDDHRSEFDTYATPLCTASIRALACRELEQRR